jgi:hypothetical protein
MRQIQYAVVVSLLGLAALTGAFCAKARHVVIQADQSFAAVVFALDETEFNACQPTTVNTAAGLAQATCDTLNPKIKQLLVDVRAVTQALRDTPTDAPLPKSIPAILKGLTDVQRIIGDLGAGPVKARLVAQVTASLDKAIALLQQFTTGGA